MKRLFTLVVLLALGFFFPTPAKAYVPAPKAGVLLAKVEKGDTVYGVCLDLFKKGMLPSGFSAVRCKNAALERNFGSLETGEEEARRIQVGDLLFFPYLPLAESERRLKTKLATSYEEALGNLGAKLNLVYREKKSALADLKVAEARLREWQFGAFLGMAGLTIFAVLIFFITRWYCRTEVTGLKGKVSFFEAELGRWKPGGTAMYGAMCPDGTYLRVSFERIGSGLKERNGELVPFVKLRSSAKIPDPVIHEENAEEHILKHFWPQAKSELKQPRVEQTWSLQ